MTPINQWQEKTRALLRRMNMMLLLAGAMSVPLTFLLAGLPLLLIMILLMVCATIAALRSYLHNVRLASYALAIFCSILVVWVISFTGFYGPHTHVGNEFQAGRGTYVIDKRTRTAVVSSVLWPEMFTAAIFGFDCNGYWNCSNTAWVAGVLTDYVILAGGLVCGNLLVVRQLKAHHSHGQD
jgi:hypothetical protein